MVLSTSKSRYGISLLVLIQKCFAVLQLNNRLRPDNKITIHQFIVRRVHGVPAGRKTDNNSLQDLN